MGADFVLTFIPICKLNPARNAKLMTLLDAMLENGVDEYGRTEEDILIALEDYKREKWVFSREVSTIEIRGVVYYTTGGMTWGDCPTEAYDELNALGDFFDLFEKWALEDFEAKKKK